MPIKETNNKTMRIEKVWGTDHTLYSLIGPFVLNPDVIRINGGYPFKNTEDHVWYISITGKNMVTGFISIVNNKLCNDFTWQDYDLLELLIIRAMADLEKDTVVYFTANSHDLPTLLKLGFTMVKPGINYFKMSKKI